MKIQLMIALMLGLAAPLFAESSAEEYFARGEQLLGEKDWKGAARQFSRAADAKKDYWDAYEKWGEALFNQGEMFEAITKFKLAVSLNPRFTEAWYHLGLGYENINLEKRVRSDEKALKKLAKTQYQDALAAYSKALAIAPANDERAVADAHFRMGVLLRDLEMKKTEGNPNLKPAMIHLETALSMYPDSPEMRNELGRLYDLIGRYPEAVAQYSRAIEKNKYFAQAYSNRGVAWWHDGNWDNALADCRRAVEIDPKFAGGHYNLAEVVFARVQEIRSDKERSLFHPEVQRAIDEYKLATELEPDFSAAWHGLARAYRAYHDLDKAKEVYEQILSKDKKDKLAKQALKDMKTEEKALLKHIPKEYQNSDSIKK